MLPFDPRELVRSGGLTLAARTVVEGLLAGRHPGVIRDFTPEVVGNRAYQPGDEPRRVDWRASGRTDRLLVRETAAQSNLVLFSSTIFLPLIVLAIGGFVWWSRR